MTTPELLKEMSYLKSKMVAVSIMLDDAGLAAGHNEMASHGVELMRATGMLQAWIDGIVETI